MHGVHDNHLYLNSHFVRGTVLWDDLSEEIHKSVNSKEFTNNIIDEYSHFEDLLA